MAGSDRDAPVLSRRALLTLGAGATLAVAAPSLTYLLRQGVTAVPEGTAATPPGASRSRPGHARLGSFDFRPAGLPEIPVHYALGAGDPGTARLVVVMHGDSRNAGDYRDAWADLIADLPLVVVAPEFNQNHFPGAREYNQGGLLDAHDRLRPRSAWTFSYIEPLFHQMRQRLAGQQTSFDLFGHSAGAQFVHRYVELAPSPLLRSAIAANAGWYTMPDPAIDYPYGSGGVTRGLVDWSVTFATQLTVLLGQDDVLDDNLRHDDGADAQGLTRWARGHAFYDRARHDAAALGLPFAWQLRAVAGVGHDYQAMSAAALELWR